MAIRLCRLIWLADIRLVWADANLFSLIVFIHIHILFFFDDLNIFIGRGLNDYFLLLAKILFINCVHAKLLELFWKLLLRVCDRHVCILGCQIRIVCECLLFVIPSASYLNKDNQTNKVNQDDHPTQEENNKAEQHWAASEHESNEESPNPHGQIAYAFTEEDLENHVAGNVVLISLLIVMQPVIRGASTCPTPLVVASGTLHGGGILWSLYGIATFWTLVQNHKAHHHSFVVICETFCFGLLGLLHIF